MSKYYDTKLRTATGVQGDNTIAIDDERVSAFFKRLSYDERLSFDAEGLPVIDKLALDADGSRFRYYLATPDANGIFQPDIAKNDLYIEEKRKFDIITKADDVIDTAYDQRTQMKIATYTTKLQGKIIASEPLSSEETLKYEFIMTQFEPWIASVRAIENSAITNGTPADQVDFALAGEAPQL